jgi:ribosomal protein S18 acetylase RimI-like enzyme
VAVHRRRAQVHLPDRCRAPLLDRVNPKFLSFRAVSTRRHLPPQFAVRPVREEEWVEYRELRLRALSSDPLAFGSTLEREQAFTPETWKERISRGRSSNASLSWVALSPSGRFVGMAVAAEVEGTLHLFGMWVDPEVRGSGVGGRLLDAALEWVRRSHSGRTLVLEVNPRQEAAVHLYQSRGFRPTGRSSDLGHTSGERVVEMTLRPSSPETSGG